MMKPPPNAEQDTPELPLIRPALQRHTGSRYTTTTNGTHRHAKAPDRTGCRTPEPTFREQLARLLQPWP